MQIEIKVPAVGESITEVEVGNWLKGEGEPITKDENLVVIESEKTTLELPSPVTGSVGKIVKQKGQTAKIGEVIAYLQQGAAAPKAAPQAENKPEPQRSQEQTAPKVVMPAAARVIAENGLSAENIQGSGPGGRVLKEDALKQSESKAAPAQPPSTPAAPMPPPQRSVELSSAIRQEEVVPMTRLRKTLAERLVQAQHTAALLTTFNEVDMSEVMNLRKVYQDSFVQKYGVKLGFMSFFVKAVVDAPPKEQELWGDQGYSHTQTRGRQLRKADC